MDERTLSARARALGLSRRWRDATGQMRHVGNDSLRHLLRVLNKEEAVLHEAPLLPPLVVGEVDRPTPLPAGVFHGKGAFRLELEDGGSVEGFLHPHGDGTCLLPAMTVPGYHRLHLHDAMTTLAIAPARCCSVAKRAGRRDPRLWGVAAQIYGLRMPHDGGIGNFSAVESLARQAAAQGADALALSPVHAMFAAAPERYSPYSPSSRLFLNVLLADPHCVFSAHDITMAMHAQHEAPGLLSRLQDADLIDWPRAAQVRMRLLRRLYDHVIAPAPPAAMTEFVTAGGEDLRRHAIFEALHAQEIRKGPQGGNWRMWPPCLRRPDSEEVRDFARLHAADVEFHGFVQWMAATSLRRACEGARNAGMKIGLIMDLAVGVDPGGSQCWAQHAQFLTGLSIGAPPDVLSPMGQNWGLTGFSPVGLRHHGYAAFIQTLRAGFAHGGGLRIDHVMGLQRLWIIPEGGSPMDGAYLAFPGADLMRLIALESLRHEAIVVGEDLGTVAPSFRRDARRHAIMGMSVLWFQRHADGTFMAPPEWAAGSIGMTSTHDLPTVAGWWLGSDLDWRERLRQAGPRQHLRTMRARRQEDRRALWQVLAGDGHAPLPPLTPEGAQAVVDAAARFIGMSAAELAILPLEDALGLVEQPNLPGTVDGHPNWRRRYPAGVHPPLSSPDAMHRLALLRKGREMP
ncbi:4-alpha-glucanotransferase [Novacetimonas maltaceti]|uniref:4-alpha-glucanotransferase n=1 Tax=Novacetimonas maltaceti TaxID=1203393 RepID=A0A2S3W621_9PROT|nr:4-alpha-glucanotransferase [Novacetimonas maltaceti]POF64322.1 4-alpha-glucanotransferase [Novacetimonas maltaceti]PYD61425.1 4-alpha-glucanotransferase [Novacetimonas maltaceti]